MEGLFVDRDSARIGSNNPAECSAVKSEPFYVAIITPVTHHCMEGLFVDRDSACVGSNNLAIPGLHAAGGVAGGVHGNNRFHSICIACLGRVPLPGPSFRTGPREGGFEGQKWTRFLTFKSWGRCRPGAVISRLAQPTCGTASHEVDHNHLHGCRVGEASHPGPATTSPLSFLGPEFAKQIQAQIEAAVQAAIAQALSQLDIPGLAVGALSPAQSPKRKRRRKGKGSGDATVALNASVAPSTPDLPRAADQGKGKDKAKGTATAPRSVQLNAAGRGANKSPVPQPGPKPPKVGKGKGAGAGPSQDQAWTVVSRRHKDSDEAFQLRAQDWDAPLLSFAGLGATIEAAKADQTLSGVLLATKDDCATALRMLQSAGKPFSVMFVCLGKGSGSQRIPGRVRDTLRFRDAVVEQKSSGAHLAKPAPKDLKTAPKIKQLQTSLIYVRIPQAFAPEQTWKDFKAGAQRASMMWSSSQHVQGIDSFGWVEEQLRNAPGCQLFGIMRVPTADVGTLLGVSGQRGIFVEPAKRDTHRFRIEWIPRLSKQESHDQYMQRALRGAPALGLAAFGQRIAWRHPLIAGEVLPRVWTLDGLPGTVNAQDMLPVLEQGFKEIALMSHRRKKGTLSLRFRAVCLAGDKDLVPLQLTIDQGDPVCLWAAIAPARQVETRQKPLGTKAVPFVSVVKQTSLDAKPNSAAAAESEEVDDQGKPIPSAKRARGAAREVPTGLQREACAADGNCAFASVAAALNWIQNKSGPDAYNHLELRARVASHLSKYSAQYEAEWDKVLPDGTRDKSWQDYMDAAAQAGSFASELELRALGRIFDLRILILPASDCFKPVAFHTSQKKRLAVLWLQDKHLEFLKPTCANSSCKDYPEEFWQVTDGPVRGLRAGGKASTPASSAASARTVFTCDAASRAGTVWTRAPATGSKRAGSNRRSGSSDPEQCKGRSAPARPSSVFTAAKSTVVKRQRSALPAEDPNPKRTCASGRQPSAKQSCPRRAATAAKSVTTSQDLQGCEADESNLEALRECDAAPKLHYASKCVPQLPRVKNYRERGCSCADGVARCRFCPFRKKCRDPEVAKEALRKHFAKCHPGERANPVKRRESCVRRLADEDSVHWKCKWCGMGITAADAERFGEATLIRFRNDHKTAAHPRLSWAKWNHDTRRQGDLVSWTRKISVTKRNAYVAKTLPVVRELEGRDFVTFLWPRLAGKDTSKVDRYPLRFKLAWRCTRCHAPFQHDKLAREHRDKAAACPSLNAVRLAKVRLQTLEEYRQLHDQAPASAKKQQGESVFATARDQLRAPLSAV